MLFQNFCKFSPQGLLPVDLGRSHFAVSNENGGRDALNIVIAQCRTGSSESVANIDPREFLIPYHRSPQGLVGGKADRVNLQSLRMILLVDRKEHLLIEEFLGGIIRGPKMHQNSLGIDSGKRNLLGIDIREHKIRESCFLSL